jgi:RecB family exonuclease
MPEPLHAVAPARLSTYADCPRRYRLVYLEATAQPRGGWAHTSVGASVHQALARWWDLPLARRTPRAGGELVASGWLSEGFRDERQSVATRERARAQVERYLDGVEPSHEPVAVERVLSVRTGHASLWGRVDRLDDRGAEGLVVVDYKTGRSVPRAEDARDSLALAVYAAAAARTLRRDCRRVELHHVPSNRVLGFTHTDESLGRHLERADALAVEIGALAARRPSMTRAEADHAFPARVARRCGWCEVRSWCREGQAVPPRDRWEAVEPTPD